MLLPLRVNKMAITSLKCERSRKDCGGGKLGSVGSCGVKQWKGFNQVRGQIEEAEKEQQEMV